MPDCHCKKYWIRPGRGFVSGEYYGLEKREWYYLAALDGMSCKDLQEMEQKDMSTSQIRKERLFI